MTNEASRRTTDELKTELNRLLGFTAENILRLAVIVKELESRGEDLTSLRLGLLPILRQIACGQLVPEAVVAFAGQPDLLRKLTKLPIEDQKKIVSGKKMLPPTYVPRKPAPTPIPSRGRVPAAYLHDDEEENEQAFPCLREDKKPLTPRQAGEKAAGLVLQCKDKCTAIKQFMESIWDNGDDALGEMIDAVNLVFPDFAKTQSELKAQKKK